MYYVQLRDQVAVELIPEVDPMFPGVPITERFSKDFLDKCVTSDTEVTMGYIYDPVGKKFNAPTIVTPEEPTPTIEVARKLALQRLEGCCSAAVYTGTDVTPSTARGKHHYSFPTTAQNDISQMMTAIADGETSFSYKADDEKLNIYSAEEIKVLSKALRQLCTACTKYKEELEDWIARETSMEVMSTIKFGIKLPDDLTKDLVDYLTSLGIDVSMLSMLK